MSLSDITTFIAYNSEQAKYFIKKRPTGVFSKRNFHEAYINNIDELYRLYKLDARYTNIRDLIKKYFPSDVFSKLESMYEAERKASIRQQNSESDLDASIADLDSLSDELKDEKAKRDQPSTISPLSEISSDEAISDLDSLSEELKDEKAKRDQVPQTSKSPLDELLDEIDRGMATMSHGVKEAPANFQQVDKEVLDELLAPLERSE